MASGSGSVATANNELNITVGNEIDDIAPVSVHVADLLATNWSACPSRTRRIVIALQEAISNAVLHGNLGLSSSLRENGNDEFLRLAEVRRRQTPWKERIVCVRCCVNDHSAEIVVTDQGDGFEPAAVRSCVDGSGIYKMSGRGIAIMEALMDNVVFNDGGRTVILTINRDTNS